MLSVFPTLQVSPHRFAFHVPTRTAICADLHFGIHASLARGGLFVPATDLPTMERRWSAMLAMEPSQVVIAGDLFDALDPGTAAIETCLSFLRQARCPIAITPGNHDPANMAGLLGGMNVTIQAGVALDNLYISHGHEAMPAGVSAMVWIVGHQHPALTLSTAVHTAKMVCFAMCDLPEGQTARHVLVLPAFCPTSLGSNLSVTRNWLLPFARPAARAIRIFGIVEPETREPQVLDFGPLSMHVS